MQKPNHLIPGDKGTSYLNDHPEAEQLTLLEPATN